MNKTIALLFFFLITSNMAKSQEFKTKVKAAKVYLNQAEVIAEANVKIPAGRSTIYLTNIGASVDENSIQIESNGTFTLMNVKYMPDFQNTVLSPMQDSIRLVESQIEQKKMELSILDDQQKIVLNNSKIKGDNNNLIKSELEDMLNYFKVKLNEIGNSKLEINKEIKNLERKLGVLKNEFSQSGGAELVLGKIELILDSKTSQNAIISANYLVHSAGWQPNYDVRVKDVSAPVNIISKANVWQNSGVSWQNVDLVLSTANPNISGVRPELYPKYLNFYQRPVYGQAVYMSKRDNLLETAAMDANAKAAMVAPPVDQVESTFATEYVIKDKYSINSSYQQTAVAINDIDLKADYTYLAVPKIQNDVLLTATIKDFEEHRFIPGQANIFYDNVFVSKSYINGINVEDSLQFGLGADKRIIVERKEKRDYKNRKAIGSNIKEDFTYQISVKNTKNSAIEIVVEDQIPVSQDSAIEVEINDINGATKNDEGKLTWKFNLKPMETKQISVSYSVKYPKNKQVSNL